MWTALAIRLVELINVTIAVTFIRAGRSGIILAADMDGAEMVVTTTYEWVE